MSTGVNLGGRVEEQEKKKSRQPLRLRAAGSCRHPSSLAYDLHPPTLLASPRPERFSIARVATASGEGDQKVEESGRDEGKYGFGFALTRIYSKLWF